MLRMKAQMSLEYIAKMMIVLVVVAVVIGMIYNFRGDILEKWKVIADPDENDDTDNNAAFIEGGPFSPDDFAHFIELCWVETRDAEDSRVCFVLKGTADPGTVAGDIDTILAAEYPEIASSVDFTGVDFGDDLFSINYVIIGNEIHVKS